MWFSFTRMSHDEHKTRSHLLVGILSPHTLLHHLSQFSHNIPFITTFLHLLHLLSIKMLLHAAVLHSFSAMMCNISLRVFCPSPFQNNELEQFSVTQKYFKHERITFPSETLFQNKCSVGNCGKYMWM